MLFLQYKNNKLWFFSTQKTIRVNYSHIFHWYNNKKWFFCLESNLTFVKCMYQLHKKLVYIENEETGNSPALLKGVLSLLLRSSNKIIAHSATQKVAKKVFLFIILRSATYNNFIGSFKRRWRNSLHHRWIFGFLIKNIYNAELIDLTLNRKAK